MSRLVWLLVALLADGCSVTTAPSTDGWPWHSLSVSGTVSLAGESRRSGDTVLVRLTFRDRGSTTARVEFGACAFGVQGVGRHGAEWDNHPAPNGSCADSGLVVDLKPGESRDIPLSNHGLTHSRIGSPELRQHLHSGPRGRRPATIPGRWPRALSRRCSGHGKRTAV